MAHSTLSFRTGRWIGPALLLAGIGLLPLARAQEADNGPDLPPARKAAAPAADADQTDPHRKFLGVDQCVRCHASGLPKSGGADDPAFGALFGGGAILDDSWVLFDEIRTWSNDKHSQAYLSLLNERSKRMGEIMGVPEIHRDRRCLACHTGVPIPTLPVDPQTGLAAASIESDRKVTLGVSCEGCHGASGDAVGKVDAKGWYVPHASKETWRFLSPETKLEEYGFIDVRTPVARAKLCLSCHLGNAAEGKVVTHEMYAAGHPPLPAFEIETFMDQMPEHWRDFEDKPSGIREEYTRRTMTGFDPQTLHDTRGLLVNAIVSLSENVRLTADLAQGDTPPFAHTPWPELSQFDCFACHHDLRSNGWRQSRPSNGPPGRPELREWPDALARIAFATLGEQAAEAERALRQVQQSLQQQPFGERSALIEHGRRFVQSAEALARKLQSAPLSRAEGERIRRAIAETAARQVVDYDSARQLVWAFGIVDRELAQRGEDDPIARILASLQDDFILDLRGGRTVKQALPGSTVEREVKEVDLSKTLPPIATYNPAAFQQKFQQILALLPKE